MKRYKNKLLTIILVISLLMSFAYSDCDELIYNPCDVNNDGNGNILDAIMVVNYILEYETPTEIQFCASDVNEGGVLNVLDLLSGLTSLSCWNPGE